VVQRLAQLARSVDYRAHVEPYSLQNDHSARPDLTVSSTRGVSLIDVSVTHPGATSFLAKASKEQGSCAAAREVVKNTKYKSMAEKENAKFYPFVIESHGLLGPGALSFLKVLSNQAASQLISTAPLFMKNARSLISIALQNGNAHIARQALMGLRTAARAGRGGD
jgi:hypothetical protein